MLLLVLLIMGCSLVGTVLLLGVCAPISAVIYPTAPAKNDLPTTVIEESVRDDRNFDTEREESTFGGNSAERAIQFELRAGIAGSSVPILRARGMTDAQIKSELLRDFSLTGEQADKILAAQESSRAGRVPGDSMPAKTKEPTQGREEQTEMYKENTENESGYLRESFCKEIVARSIRILRERGRSDAEIKEEMLRDFSIKAEELDEMLKA